LHNAYFDSQSKCLLATVTYQLEVQDDYFCANYNPPNISQTYAMSASSTCFTAHSTNKLALQAYSSSIYSYTNIISIVSQII